MDTEIRFRNGVLTGRVATGDQFIADGQKKAWIRETFRADCTEMEGASIAHACRRNDLPFVIIRAISDQADDDAGMTYAEFEAKSARVCADLVYEMVMEL